MITDNSAPPPLPAQVSIPTIQAAELELRLQPLTKSELEAAANAWLGIAWSKASETVEVLISLRTAEGEAEDKLREKVTALTAERNASSPGKKRKLHACECLLSFNLIGTSRHVQMRFPSRLHSWRERRLAIATSQTLRRTLPLS
jgi:hypothetical protein